MIIIFQKQIIKLEKPYKNSEFFQVMDEFKILEKCTCLTILNKFC